MFPGLHRFEKHLSRMRVGELPCPADEDALADLLTEGYAHVATLEADSVRLERKLVEPESAKTPSDYAALGRRLAASRRRTDALRRALAGIAMRSRCGWSHDAMRRIGS